MNTVKSDYSKIIAQYVEKNISTETFKDTFAETYLNESRDYDDEIFHILDRLFAEIDLCTDDTDLLNNFDFYVTEEQLRESAEKALLELKKVKT